LYRLLIMIRTLKYRIKDSTSRKRLEKLAGAVNFVWNYINDLSYRNIKEYGRFLSAFDITYYLIGGSKELNLGSDSLGEIARVYITARNESHKRCLSWRSAKRNLGWIPFKGRSIKTKGDAIIYGKRSFRFYKSRPIEGTIKSGCFSQDSRGRWYLCLVVELDDTTIKPQSFVNKEIGIDLGVKNKLTLSDGTKYSRENLTKSYEEKLAIAQRAHKLRQVSNIHSKIKNSRMDWNHKTTTEICHNFQKIVVGNIQIMLLIEAGFKATRKALLDSSLSQIKCFFTYKAKKLGNTYIEVNEAYTTMMCSSCGALSGPAGEKDLNIREWECPLCHALHDRDTNSAINILRLGH
jgi:putative transposase